jgi:DNA polymerase-3 subunit delta'
VSWQRVHGHELLVQSFADVVKRGRLGHAYLFTGPSGVGKKLFAFELAKTLLCEKRGDKFDACDRCPSCIQVDAGTHPDVIFAWRPEEKHEFPIAVIVGDEKDPKAPEGLIERLSRKPARGGYKIAIVDDADDFNEESANAFLKTLEEPPPNTLLILLATDLNRQLPTILSRCQVIHFAPLRIPLVAELLKKQDVEADRAERIARLSGGSIGQARELTDDAIWSFRRNLVEALASPRTDTVQLAEKLWAFVEEAGKESSLQRRRASLMIKLLIELLETALNASVGVKLPALDKDDQTAVQSLASRLSTDRLLQLIDRSLEAHRQIERKVQLVLAVEGLADALR